MTGEPTPVARFTIKDVDANFKLAKISDLKPGDVFGGTATPTGRPHKMTAVDGAVARGGRVELRLHSVSGGTSYALTLNPDEQVYLLMAKTRREWFDVDQYRWVSAEGYEVCQDHCGPRALCPFKHDGRRRTAG